MNLGKSCIAALMMIFGLVAQGQAAPAGFTEHKLDGLSIAVPSTWKLAPKEALAQFEKQAPGAKFLMMAEGDVNNFPKFTIVRRPQPTLSQEDFAKLDENAVKALCEQFTGQMAQTQGATDLVCKRVKTDKGVALLTQFNVAQAKATSLNYMFFQGPKDITIISGVVLTPDAAKLVPVIEQAVKTTRLSK